MPKNPVTDPITDQEITFAHLLLAGHMTDRDAAKAAGLNPGTAAYTKAKPRVRDYMLEHRAAVRDTLLNQQAEDLRQLNLSRAQILTRLWELARLDPEATRGSIAGQIKAITMIVAIEGLIPDRHLPPPRKQTAASPVPPSGFPGEELDQQHHQAEAALPTDPVPAAEAPPNLPLSPKPNYVQPSSNPDRNQPGVLNPFVYPEKLNTVPDATAGIFAANLDRSGACRPPFTPPPSFGRGRR